MDQARLIQISSSLNKYLINLLSNFDKNKEWADLSTWLQKVEQTIRDYPSPYITDKIIFGKRLAQCLNPSLPPAIHEQTLKIYEMIFVNMRETSCNNYELYCRIFCSDMGIYSVGLFPFYQNATPKLKSQLLQIIKDYYLPLKRQIIPCLPGLLQGLLPGLDDNVEHLIKDLFKTLELIKQMAGRKYFIGCLWMAIMRQQRGRASGIKLLGSLIPKVLDPLEDIQNPSDEEDSPTIAQQKQIDTVSQSQKMMESQVIKVDVSQQQIEKQEISTENWNDFDKEMSIQNPNTIIPYSIQESVTESRIKYIESGIDNNDDDNNYPNKGSLIINALMCCIEDENNLVRRNILDFMITHIRADHKMWSHQNALILVESVLYLLKNKDVSVSRRVNTWLFGKPDMENKYQVGQHNRHILDYVIEAFQNIFKNTPTDSQNGIMPIKILQNFYYEHEHLIPETIQALSTSFIRYVYLNYKGTQFAGDILKSGQRFFSGLQQEIHLIITSLSDEMLKNIKEKSDQQCLQIINLTEFALEQLIKQDEQTDVEGSQNSLLQTLSGLFLSFSKLTEDDIQQFVFISPALNLCFKIIEKLETLRNQRESSNKISDIYEDPIVNQQSSSIQDNDNSQNMLNSRQNAHYQLDRAIDQFTIFLQNIVNILSIDQNTENMDNILKISTQILIKVLRFLIDKDLRVLPKWFQCITKCIIMESHISLIAIDAMINILISEEKDPIYKTLKNLIVEQSKSKFSENNQVVLGSEYMQLTLQTLWSFLDYQHYTDQVIEYIIHFIKFFPQYFKEVIQSSFNIKSITEKEKQIRRFALFWKLTKPYFQENINLQDLNKIGLFVMLDFLDHENPLIRHASKNWLIESVPQLYRIIDPLFEELILSNNNYYFTDQGQCIYTKQYETSRTNETFKKFKSILMISSDVFLKYICNVRLTKNMEALKLQFTSLEDSVLFNNPEGDDTISIISTNQNNQIVENLQQIKEPKKKMTYLDLLVLLCLRFMLGFALESTSNIFHLENSAVNASSCEFLEMLISHIEDPKISMAICRYFWYFIENKDYVMQIQLLNLLKVIFFHSSFSQKNTYSDRRNILVPILSSKSFIPSILVGLKTDISYVRALFITFISTSIPLLSNYLVHPMLTNCVKSVMFAYYKLIQQLQREIPNQSKSLQKTKSLQQIQIQIQQSQTEQQNSYEISNILSGIAVILNYFLKLKKIEELEQQIKDRAQAQTFGDTVASVFSLGLYSAIDDKKIEYNFEKHPESCECILYDIKQVVEILIHSWSISKEFSNQCNFTDIGCPQYTYEKFKGFNPILQEIIKQEGSLSKLKIQILKLFKPLFLQYPSEIMNAIIILWNREAGKDVVTINQEFESSQFMRKIIEVLIFMNIQSDVLLDSVYGSYFLEKIQQNYQKRHPKEKKNIFYLNYEYALNETRLIYFLYIYFSYNLIESDDLKKESLLNFWMQTFKVLRILAQSKNPSTVLWMTEFIYMLSIKYSPKEILNDKKFKKEFHDLLSEKLNYQSSFASQQFQLIFNEQLTQNLKEKQKVSIQQFQIKYKLIIPFSPYHYEMMLQYLDILELQIGGDDELSYRKMPSEIYLNIFGNLQSSDEEDLYNKYRLITIKTMQNLALPLLQNSYTPEKNESRVIFRTKEFMDPMFVIIENKQSNVSNHVFMECTSDLLYSLLKSQPTHFVKEFKKQIISIFNQDNFFNCNKQTIRFYSKIVNLIVQQDKTSNLFSEYLDKVTLTTSFFSKESTENKKRIKNFKRICFIIFSGERDQYTDKLQILLDKVSEVFKNAENAHPSLIILIFFCLRILILRLSSTNLNQLFRQIWPMLISLLIQIYSHESHRNKLGDQPIKNTNLLLAGLKLIEILSITQLEEFFLHQWIFFFDYFGLQIEHKEQVPENLQKSVLIDQKSQIKKTLPPQISPFQFQPSISNIIQNEKYQLNYQNQQLEQQEQYKKRTRKLIMQQSFIEDELALREQALQLAKYLMSNNEFRTQVDMNVIEGMFEDDFIFLDEMALGV